LGAPRRVAVQVLDLVGHITGIAEQYVAAFGNLAKTSNTLIVPSNLADLATLVTTATTMFKAQER